MQVNTEMFKCRLLQIYFMASSDQKEKKHTDNYFFASYSKEEQTGSDSSLESICSGKWLKIF